MAEAAELRILIGELMDQYLKAMREGGELQYKAWVYMNEAEAASDSYVEMRAEFRARAGNDGHGNATNDFKFSKFKEAEAAGKDNAWYNQRATMMAGMAAMSFSRATALMADLARTEAKLARLTGSSVG